jgi:hypothetical protein
VIRGLRVPVHLTSRDALRIFDLADIWAARTGAEVTLVSGNDHIHTPGSAHYEGEALDFHSSNSDELSEVFRLAGYRVLWKVPGHFAHVHVERVTPGGGAWRAVQDTRRALRQSTGAVSEGHLEARNLPARAVR